MPSKYLQNTKSSVSEGNVGSVSEGNVGTSIFSYMRHQYVHLIVDQILSKFSEIISDPAF